MWILERATTTKLWRALLYRYRVLRGHTVTNASLHRRIRNAMVVEATPWNLILRRDPCCYCNSRVPFHSMTVEHVLPRHHGGHDRADNKAGCCARCNRARGAMPLLVFLTIRHSGPKSNRERRLLTRLRSPYPRRDEVGAPPLRVPMRELVRWKDIN